MTPEPLNRLHALVLAWEADPENEECRRSLGDWLAKEEGNKDVELLIQAVYQAMDDRRPDLGLWAIHPLLVLALIGAFPPLFAAGVLGALGSILMQAGRYGEAEEAAREGLRLRIENSAPPLVIADSHGSLGSILMDAGRYGEAEEEAREGLRLRIENSAPPLVIADSHGALGSILRNAGRYREAEEAARQGLRLQIDSGAPPLVIALSHAALGSILMQAGRHREAEEAAREGLRLQIESSAPPLVIAESHAALGSILMDAGRHREAEEEAREGLRLRIESSAPPLVIADSHAALGSILMDAGRYGEAEEQAREGLRLQIESGAPPLVIALSHGALGSILTQAGRYGEAEEQARQGLRLQIENGAPPLVIGQSHGALGSILMDAGRHREAEEEAREGLRLRIENGAPPLVIALSHAALATILMQAGRDREAEEAAREGLRLEIENGAPPLVIADSHGALGSILTQAGRKDEAVQELTQALDLAMKYGGTGELPITSSHQLAKLAAADERAMRHSQTIGLLIDHALSLNLAEDHFQAIRSYAFVFNDAIQWAMEEGRQDLALEWMDRSRGLAFTLALARQTARQETEEELAALAASQAAVQARLAREPGSREVLDELQSLARRKDSLIASERKRVEALIESPARSAERIPDGALFLALQPLGDSVLVYALSQRGPFLTARSFSTEIVTEGDHQGELRILARIRSSGGTELESIKDSLFSQEVQMMICAADRVILSPGGGLGQLPFEAMAFEGRRLDKRCIVSRGSTLALLGFVRTQPAPGLEPRILAMGMNDGNCDGPHKGLQESAPEALEARRGALDSERIPRLRHAEDEAKDVACLYGREPALLGKDALASEARAKARDAAIFHPSVHGLGRHDDPLLSFLMMQPFLKPEGALLAREFLSERKMKTELAFLSACWSAGTDLFTGGESALGLHSTLIYAGVRTVIATTLPVSDLLAKEMSVAFHREMRKGLAAHEALRNVRLAALGGSYGLLGMRIMASHVFVLHGDPMMRLPKELLEEGAAA